MDVQIPLSPNATADMPERDAERDDRTHEVADDLAYQRLAIVNVVFYGHSQAAQGGWVLIDAGVMGSTGAILSAAEKRFGKGSRPAAIILTHGHFDHVGALPDLCEKWQVPVYAHELELPYLNGNASYPPPDPTVGGGMMSALSGLYPRGPIDVSRWLVTLPDDCSVPTMPGWRWLPTPGHTPGHISLWRESDRSLIAGDAFITTRQESAYAVVTQHSEMHGPPMYYTQDWLQARISVERLAALEPELVVTGHGRAMWGQQMRHALHRLAREFVEVAVPEQGRYLAEPARVADGTAYITPPGRQAA